MAFHTKTVEQTLQELEVSATGLSKTEAADRLEQYGPNTITVHGEPFWRKLVEPFANVFMLVLFAAALMSLWHHAVVDAWIIFAIMAANATIYYVQRFSTERILRSLHKKNSLYADVLRENQTVRVDAALLVPGDVILLDEGEKIPADSRLLVVESLRVDESQLTGESLPIEKQIDALPEDKEIYERSNMVYQGSFVVGGRATAVVVGTGNDTEFGKLAVLSVAPIERSPVQQKIDSLISKIIRVVAAVAAVTFLLALYRDMSLAESIRYVLAVSVSAVPESLPVAITVVLVLGMRRMAKKKALVKAVQAIETIGTITVIATDKTGTLTKNRLTVQDTWRHGEEIIQTKHAVARAITFSKSKTHDPLDVALQSYVGSEYVALQKHITASLPFDQEMAMSGNIVKETEGSTLWVKGAPEQILSRSALSKAEHTAAVSQLHSFAGQGFRIIAFAHLEDVSALPSFADLPAHKQFVFDGFVAIADVLRPEAKHAIRVARQAGIRVCMITGDHFETAFHIARELGIVDNRNQVFDCRVMHTMSDDQLERVIQNIGVFSRVIPEHKHRILAILKKTHITAMTGDGVNDVPALTNAHVGIAMGSGASIAKDAGDIILLDDNFRSIVSAVHEGRTIHANIKRMVAYLLSTNAGEVMVAMGSLIAGIPVPLVAVQILWVNLVTDTCMVIPLGLEPGEKRNMMRPPQSPKAPLFSRFMASRIFLVATTMAVLTLTIYVTAIQMHGETYARTIAFHALVVMQWASAFCYRSDYESVFLRLKRFSPAFYVGLSIAISMQVLAMSGLIGHWLHMTPIALSDIALTTLVAFTVPITVVELHKWVGRHYFNKGHINAYAEQRRK